MIFPTSQQNESGSTVIPLCVIPPQEELAKALVLVLRFGVELLRKKANQSLVVSSILLLWKSRGEKKYSNESNKAEKCSNQRILRCVRILFFSFHSQASHS